MKVRIGKYVSWFGPYQLAELLTRIGIDEDTCHDVGSWLETTWVGKFLSWVHSKKKRKIQIVIDDFDTWSMDSTLALIILPMLIQLQKTKHGSPLIDEHDVPPDLHDTDQERAFFHKNGTTTDKYHKRWEWVLNEMVFAFTMKNDEDWEDRFYTDRGESTIKETPNGMFEMVWEREPIVDREGIKATQERIKNGFRLFGKYFESLWD